jgi:hypothetical protein
VDATHILDQVFAGSTALAGLILVFLGVVLAGYDSYEAAQRSAVRSRYQLRGYLTFAGFLAALVSAVLAMLTNWGQSRILTCGALATLGLSFLLLLLVAFMAVRDIS